MASTYLKLLELGLHLGLELRGITVEREDGRYVFTLGHIHRSQLLGDLHPPQEQ